MNITLQLLHYKFVNAKWIDKQLFIITSQDFYGELFCGRTYEVRLFDPKTLTFFSCYKHSALPILAKHLTNELNSSMKSIIITSDFWRSVRKEYITPNDELSFRCVTTKDDHHIRLVPTNIFEFCKVPSVKSVLHKIFFIVQLLFVDLPFDVRNIVTMNMLNLWYNDFDTYAQTIVFK